MNSFTYISQRFKIKLMVLLNEARWAKCVPAFVKETIRYASVIATQISKNWLINSLLIHNLIMTLLAPVRQVLQILVINVFFDFSRDEVRD